MFDSVGWGELAVLLVVALFVVGPERLPGVAADAGRALRKLRLYIKGMTADLKSELGPEFQDVDLKSLHPRTFVQKHLLEDDDDDDSTFDLLDGGSRGRRSAATRPAATRPAAGGPAPSQPLGPQEQPPWDPDAT